MPLVIITLIYHPVGIPSPSSIREANVCVGLGGMIGLVVVVASARS